MTTVQADRGRTGFGEVAATPATSRLHRWRRSALAVAIVIIGVGLLVAAALAQRQPEALLEPTAPGPDGGMALVEVLGRHGIDVEVTRTLDETLSAVADSSEPTSLVMANPKYLAPNFAATLLEETRERVDRIVLVGVAGSQVEAMGLPVLAVSFLGAGEDGGRARCTSRLARPDDELTGSATARYLPRSEDLSAVACFSIASEGLDGAHVDGGSLLFVLPATTTEPEIVLFGVTGAWTNRSIDTASNAGVALRALGSSPRLVWYQPGLGDLASAGAASPGAVWPAWVRPALGVVAAAFVLFAVAVGRRLGRLVPEPLPVVVPAAETTLSRGRLYRRAGDRARTARVLRLGTVTRLRTRVGRPHGSLGELVVTVAGLSGLPAPTVEALLAGPDPTDDAALVRLARDLTDLEEKVRHHE